MKTRKGELTMETIDQQYRQGDVLLVADAIPADARPEAGQSAERAVLAHGEVTGHAHAVYDTSARVVVTPKKARHLKLVAPTSLLHEEHTAIPLDQPGYRVLRQTEWTDANEPIQVAD